MEVSLGRWTSKSGAREQGLSHEASSPVHSVWKAQGTLSTFLPMGNRQNQ